MVCQKRGTSMGSLYENIIALCKERGIKGGKMCTDLGISKGLLTDLKAGRKKGMSASTADKIASYFGVSVGYLLGTEQKETALPPLNKRDERDIEKRLQTMLGELEGPDSGSLMYSGEPLDDETRELLRISLRNQLELSKQLAKKKFTPKKYRNEGE